VKSDNRVVFKRFTSFTGDKFVQYLQESGIYLVLCHDGAMPDAAGSDSPLRSDSKQNLQPYEEDQELLRESKDSASSPSAGRLHQVNLRAMILWFMGLRYNVALINELHCADSKVWHQVLLSRYIWF
jgi:hypothetical protein